MTDQATKTFTQVNAHSQQKSLDWKKSSDVRCYFSEKYVRFLFTLICFVGASCFILLFVFIYAYRSPTRFLYLIMFVSFFRNMTGITSGAGTLKPSIAPEFSPGFWFVLCCSVFSFLCSGL